MREFIKSVFFVVSIVFALPFVMIARMNDRLFQAMSQTMSLFPGMTGNYIRRGFYYLTLKKCSLKTNISFGTLFPTPHCEIGDHVYIGPNGMISNCIIEKDVLIGSSVHILSGKNTHDFSRTDIPIRMQPSEYSTVHIGEDTWIGNCAIIMANVGKKCVIGAGSVVTKDIEDYSIAVGNPARVIRKRA